MEKMMFSWCERLSPWDGTGMGVANTGMQEMRKNKACDWKNINE